MKSTKFSTLASNIHDKWEKHLSEKNINVPTTIDTTTQEDTSKSPQFSDNGPVTIKKNRVKDKVTPPISSPSSPTNDSLRKSISTIPQNPGEGEKNFDIGTYRRRERLRIVFNIYDRDGDGFLNEKELNHFLNKTLVSNKQEEVEELLKNSSWKKISFSEFEKLCSDDKKEKQTTRASIHVTPNKKNESYTPRGIFARFFGKSQQTTSKEEDNFDEKELAEAFSIFDYNKDGILSKQDLTKVLEELGFQSIFSKEEIDSLFTRTKESGMKFEDFIQVLNC
ncbi:hypothetical protein ABK040_008173 [Willaertia magna]